MERGAIRKLLNRYYHSQEEYNYWKDKFFTIDTIAILFGFDVCPTGKSGIAAITIDEMEKKIISFDFLEVEKLFQGNTNDKMISFEPIEKFVSDIIKRHWDKHNIRVEATVEEPIFRGNALFGKLVGWVCGKLAGLFEWLDNRADNPWAGFNLDWNIKTIAPKDWQKEMLRYRLIETKLKRDDLKEQSLMFANDIIREVNICDLITSDNLSDAFNIIVCGDSIIDLDIRRIQKRHIEKEIKIEKKKTKKLQLKVEKKIKKGGGKNVGKRKQRNS